MRAPPQGATGGGHGCFAAVAHSAGDFSASTGGHFHAFRREPRPGLGAELLSIPGIGPETADSILLYAAGRPVFVVDAYTRRILSRRRIVPPDLVYAELQARFIDNLPRDP